MGKGIRQGVWSLDLTGGLPSPVGSQWPGDKAPVGVWDKVPQKLLIFCKLYYSDVLQKERKTRRLVYRQQYFMNIALHTAAVTEGATPVDPPPLKKSLWKVE